jgi:hypothetical protein
MTSYLPFLRTTSSTIRYVGLCGILTLSLGSMLYIIPSDFAFKLSTSLVFVGLYSVALLVEKPPLKKSLEMRMTASACAWVFIVLILTTNVPVGVFFIFVILGFFIIKELVDPYISRSFRQKMNVLEFSFLFLFALLITSTFIHL